MTEADISSNLTKDQWQTIVNTERIRRHLIKVGLINHRGEILQKDEHRHRSKRSRRRNTLARSFQRDLKYPTLRRRPLIASPPRRRIETNHNIQPQRSRSPKLHINEQKPKITSTTRPKQVNQTSTSTRLLSSHQLTCAKNVLLRRAVSPKIIGAADRCVVAMQYYGPDVHIEYDREWLEPNGNEIMIMQQHCGGENLLVFKGSLQPNEIFLFESRRHTDYPFALAFYINGVIDNRLSICCESRCKPDMRIGGKRGFFAIVKVDKAKACRRCRFEQRMKELTPPKPKTSNANDTSANVNQTSSSQAKPAHRTSSDTDTSRSDNSKPSVAGTSSPDADKPRNSNPTQNQPRTSSPDRSLDRRSPPKPIQTHTPSPDSVAARRQDEKPARSLTPSLDSTKAGISSPQLNLVHPNRPDIPSSGPRKSSPNFEGSSTSTGSDISSSESTISGRKSPQKRPLSSPPVKFGSKTTPNHQSKEANSNRQYASDFDESSDSIPSSISSPRETKPGVVPKTNALQIQHGDQHRARTISTDEDVSEEEPRTIRSISSDDDERNSI